MLQKIWERMVNRDESTAPVFLIVGLGNPGKEYRNTRHNLGFMVVEQLATQLGEPFKRMESHALVTKVTLSRGTPQEQRLVLVKPQTYMNLSGQAVGALARFYKVPIPNLMVVFDDVDLPFGTLRIRPGGGSSGQKGMKSIIERLGSEAFPRLRVGIGRPPGNMDAADYVLKGFSRGEANELPHILEQAADAVLVFVTQGLDKAMNQYNGTLIGE
jgi:PTH1 family peptidyl-tRNA hydrolase